MVKYISIHDSLRKGEISFKNSLKFLADANLNDIAVPIIDILYKTISGTQQGGPVFDFNNGNINKFDNWGKYKSSCNDAAKEFINKIPTEIHNPVYSSSEELFALLGLDYIILDFSVITEDEWRKTLQLS